MPESFPKRRQPRAGLGAALPLAAGLGTTLALAAGLSVAAPPPATQSPDPTDARAAVPPLQHRSAFSGYRRAADTPVGTWRDLNEATARAGGWRAYAREAGATGAAGAATPASAPASAAAPHHHHHGGHRP